MKDQVTASLTGSGWLEEAEERPRPTSRPTKQSEGKACQRIRKIHFTNSEKYMSRNQRNACQRMREIHKTNGNGWLEVAEERPNPTSSRPTKQSGGKAESLKWNSLECGWYVWHFWWRNFSSLTTKVFVSLLFTCTLRP